MDIEDYGIIGNGRSCALISKAGSLDWLCWPRFDSPSLFGGLLDQKLGFWKIYPKLKSEVTRSYIDNTNVLETHFISEKGKMSLTDFMTAFSEEEKKIHLQPEHELIRILECSEGEVEVHIHFHPQPGFGQNKISMRDFGKFGLRIELGQQLISLHSHIKFDVTKTEGAKATIKLKAGEKVHFSLTYTMEGPAVLSPTNEKLMTFKLLRTIDWWQNWANRAQYEGPYKKFVIRSALTLKLLGYAPSGAFIAAATTSLPERIGGDLNWDYRFCWLRDATFTIRALLGLGYHEEAEAFVSWLLHSTRLTRPTLKAVYDIYGEKMPFERDLSSLRGYKNSRPVRIGIATRDQLQLDIYGEVIDGVAHFIKEGGKLDRESQKMVRQLGEYVCKNWNRKDSGIWEERTDLQYYTYSHLMCWVALHQLLKGKDDFGLTKKNSKDFERVCVTIKDTIEKYAWNTHLNAYTSYMKGNSMDACVLLMPSFEFDSPTSLRMQKTFSRIKETLDVSPGLIYRYEKSINQEGAFLLCSFWKVDFLVQSGAIDEAKQEFEEILKFANDLGLFAEEVDCKTKKNLGNFPQAFTHIGLINSALLLKEKEK